MITVSGVAAVEGLLIIRPVPRITPELVTEDTVTDGEFTIVNGLEPLSVIFKQLPFPHDRYPVLSINATKLQRWLFIIKGTVY